MPNIHNIKYTGTYAIRKSNQIISLVVKEAVRMLDTKEVEYSYVKRKLSYHSDLIDIEARNIFSTKKVTTSLIKCSSRLNHYGLRSQMINQSLVNNECL